MWEVIASGVAGGLSIEALFWWSRRESFADGLPGFARGYAYWMSTLVMVILSGVVVWLYRESGIELKPIVAFNIGASTPSIITAISRAAPPMVKVD